MPWGGPAGPPAWAFSATPRPKSWPLWAGGFSTPVVGLCAAAGLSATASSPVVGNKCQIGTPEEPIDINVTTGTSDPDEESGWGPISGGFGTGFGFEYPDSPEFGFYIATEGSRLVDNSFATPGPQKCDLAGTHTVCACCLTPSN